MNCRSCMHHAPSICTAFVFVSITTSFVHNILSVTRSPIDCLMHSIYASTSYSFSLPLSLPRVCADQICLLPCFSLSLTRTRSFSPLISLRQLQARSRRKNIPTRDNSSRTPASVSHIEESSCNRLRSTAWVISSTSRYVWHLVVVVVAARPRLRVNTETRRRCGSQIHDRRRPSVSARLFD